VSVRSMKHILALACGILLLAGCQTTVQETLTSTPVPREESNANALVAYSKAHCDFGLKGQGLRALASLESARGDFLGTATRTERHCDALPSSSEGYAAWEKENDNVRKEWLRRVHTIFYAPGRRYREPSTAQNLDDQVRLTEVLDCENRPPELYTTIARIGIETNPAYESRINSQLSRTLSIRRHLCALPRGTREEKVFFVNEGHRYSREGHRPLREIVREAIS